MFHHIDIDGRRQGNVQSNTTHIDVFCHIVIVNCSIAVGLNGRADGENAIGPQQLEMGLQVMFRRIVRLVNNILRRFGVFLVDVGIRRINGLKAKVI